MNIDRKRLIVFCVVLFSMLNINAQVSTLQELGLELIKALKTNDTIRAKELFIPKEKYSVFASSVMSEYENGKILTDFKVKNISETETAENITKIEKNFDQVFLSYFVAKFELTAAIIEMTKEMIPLVFSNPSITVREKQVIKEMKVYSAIINDVDTLSDTRIIFGAIEDSEGFYIGSHEMSIINSK